MTMSIDFSNTLARAAAGDALARDQLFASLYEELRVMARRELRRSSGPLASLGATTLVHQVYESIAQRSNLAFADRPRFLAYVARAMRGMVIDAVRERRALKRGAEYHFTEFDTQVVENVPESVELVALSDALDELAQNDATLAEVVDLKYFCGLSIPEIGTLLGVSERTVQRSWEKARLLLFSSMQDIVK
jgi:RNA polymerase sigma factor (TIGR02999 family)